MVEGFTIPGIVFVRVCRNAHDFRNVNSYKSGTVFERALSYGQSVIFQSGRRSAFYYQTVNSRAIREAVIVDTDYVERFVSDAVGDNERACDSRSGKGVFT